MNKSKWIVIALAFGMMATTAGWLKELGSRQLLGPAGVKVDRVPSYDEENQIISPQSVILPADVLGMPSQILPITMDEVRTLPQDTTFGRRYYRAPHSDFGVQLSVVLMGTDHTSIHQPQYCLYSRDWAVTNTERIQLHMSRPFAYDIPAIKLTATIQDPKTGRVINCLYVYWFVSGNKITAEEGSRLWSMWKTILQKGEMERWAYVSYFATCHPGEEETTFERLEKFIQASVPDFQLVTGGPPTGRLASMAVEK